VDVLLYGLREVRGRTWTYVSTMAQSMQSTAAGLTIDGGRRRPLLEEWDRQAADFLDSRKPFLLYR
jgi:hypothetical protein